jgi:hypothetical protein
MSRGRWGSLPPRGLREGSAQVWFSLPLIVASDGQEPAWALSPRALLYGKPEPILLLNSAKRSRYQPRFGKFCQTPVRQLHGAFSFLVAGKFHSVSYFQ